MACRYIKWMQEMQGRGKKGKQKIGESEDEGVIFTAHSSRILAV